MSKTDRRLVALLALACTATFAHMAAAQRGPAPDGQGRARDTAGEFDYYSLVLSWSPTYCATSDRDRSDPQCDRHDGRRYAFVLHGLWPQHERGYPEFCATRGRPYVPQPLVDSMLDIMPSPRLVIHEYKKHGTCAGLNPAGYYALARRLYSSVRIPERFVNPFESQFVSPDEVVDEFRRVNPDIKPDMIAVGCGGAGNRLREVRVCFSKEGELRPCGRNEDQRRLCSAQRMFVPPVRSTKSGPETPPERDSPRASPLPMPRVIPSPRSL
jgi:ribonuclease T2